jgi:shikimate dehydrogenase
MDISFQKVITDWTSLQASKEVRLAVLGNPISHSLSPVMHQSALRAAGVTGSYFAIQVDENDFLPCLEHLSKIGFRGVNVTIPHKESAAKIVQTSDEVVPKIGAVNTLKFDQTLSGINTDVPAIASVTNHLTVDTALMIGAGGASLAACYALLKKGWNIRIYNRKQEKTKRLIERFHSLQSNLELAIEPSAAGCNLVINATPVGLAGAELPPLDLSTIESGATVFDMAYRLTPTPLIAWALEKGHPVVDGREMLVEQGALSFEWWFEIPAPRTVMREAVGLL